MNPLKKIADVRIGYALARIFYDDKYLVEMSAEERQETAYFKAGAAAALGLVCYLIFFVLSPVKNPDQIVPLWTQGKHYGTGDKVQHEGNVYIAESAGVAGENPPVHTTGIESDGTINWVFVASPTADDGFFEPLPSRFATNPPSIPDPVVPDAIDWLGSLVTHKPNADPIDMPQMEKAYLKGVDLADPDFKALFNNKIPKLLSDANLQDFFEQNIPDAKAAIEPYKNAAGRSMGRYGTLSTLVDHITETQPQLLTRNRRVARSWTKASDFYRDNALSDDINKADSLRPIHGGNLNWSSTLAV